MPATHTPSVSDSRVELTQLMRPQHANFRGNVHGGTLLALMDEVAYACATKFSSAYCVTVAADAIELVAPVRVGDLLTLTGAVTSTGRSSMEIGITVTAGNPRIPGDCRDTCRCFFTMVAIDDAGKPQPVPQVRLETPGDKQMHCEAQLRRDLRKRYQEELAKGVCLLPPGGEEG